MILKLACLAHHRFGSAYTAASADDRQLSADVSGDINAALLQYLGYHRGNGGLAVGSADAYGIGVHFCDDAQQLASLQNRNSAGVCRNKLGIILHNGSRADYQIGATEEEVLKEVNRVFEKAGLEPVKSLAEAEVAVEVNEDWFMSVHKLELFDTCDFD